MDPEVVAAMVGAGAAIVAAGMSWRAAKSAADNAERLQVKLAEQTASTNQEVERLKASLARDQSHIDARLDYEFDARKRLYLEVAPLLFQLTELADAARLELRRMFDPNHWRRLGMSDHARERLLERGWIGSVEYDTVYAAYSFLAPLGIYRLIQHRLTTIDLSLDRVAYTQWCLLRAVYEAHFNDTLLSSVEPALDYDPRVLNWRHLRRDNPAKHWWQGVTHGRLDTAIDCIVATRQDGVSRLITFGEFEHLFKQAASTEGHPLEKPIGAFANALFDFKPLDRPVYCRVLAVQCALFEAIYTAGTQFIGRTLDEEAILASLCVPPDIDEVIRRSSDLYPELGSVVDRYLKAKVLPALV